LLTETGLLEPAERRLHRSDQALVHANKAISQAFHDAKGAAEIARIEIAGQTKGSVVGHGDAFGLFLEAEDGRDGTEDLLLHEAHSGRGLRQHGRLEKSASKIMTFAA